MTFSPQKPSVNLARDADNKARQDNADRLSRILDEEALHDEDKVEAVVKSATVAAPDPAIAQPDHSIPL